jgi:peptidoglycan hydrolase-like protein with peptidoglycan-binding domain
MTLWIGLALLIVDGGPLALIGLLVSLGLTADPSVRTGESPCLFACSMFGGGNSNHASYVSPQSPALSQNTIARVQSRLQQAGDYNGAIDGLWGPATEAGVRSYQQQHGLSATGQLDGDTLASLNLGGTNQTYGNTQPAVSPQPAATAQPTSQSYGSNNIPPATTDMPVGNATQPNASTIR